MDDYKIIQIISAPQGMKSKYKCADEDIICSVVCLALVEYEDGEREILAMDITDGDGLISEVGIDSKDFIGIITE